MILYHPLWIECLRRARNAMSLSRLRTFMLGPNAVVIRRRVLNAKPRDIAIGTNGTRNESTSRRLRRSAGAVKNRNLSMLLGSVVRWLTGSILPVGFALESLPKNTTRNEVPTRRRSVLTISGVVTVCGLRTTTPCSRRRTTAAEFARRHSRAVRTWTTVTGQDASEGSSVMVVTPCSAYLRTKRLSRMRSDTSIHIQAADRNIGCPTKAIPASSCSALTRPAA